MKKQAGEEAFADYGYGTNANRVFQNLRQEAQEEHGSRGYTGSIAEKSSFVMATRQVMTLAQAREYANNHMYDYDKWGMLDVLLSEKKRLLLQRTLK